MQGRLRQAEYRDDSGIDVENLAGARPGRRAEVLGEVPRTRHVANNALLLGRAEHSCNISLLGSRFPDKHCADRTSRNPGRLSACAGQGYTGSPLCRSNTKPPTSLVRPSPSSEKLKLGVSIYILRNIPSFIYCRDEWLVTESQQKTLYVSRRVSGRLRDPRPLLFCWYMHTFQDQVPDLQTCSRSIYSVLEWEMESVVALQFYIM
ncbi:hypothetical protein H105_03854, partial [Trichophyton soudanense CBS 452.61]